MIFYAFTISVLFQRACILLTECKEINEAKESKIGIIILSQHNPHHNALAEFRKRDIFKQVEANPDKVYVEVFKSHSDFGNIDGHWTVLPLFKKLNKLSGYSWFFFMEETTKIQINKLNELLSQYNKSKDVFVGHALIDESPTIIHHFATPSLSYPLFSSGFFLSFSVIKRLTKKCDDCAFSIDAKYELAKYVWDTVGIEMVHEPRLCLRKDHNCVSWREELPDCRNPVSSHKISVAVKTCGKYHSDRVSVVKKTWGRDVDRIRFFSDVEDASIPTTKLSVQNVESGHCEKTLSIMKHYVHGSSTPAQWLLIADDDTLISFPRLRRLLTCYSPEQHVALGERYGYGVVSGSGYDYPTGGSGMVFSMPTVRQLVRSCSCPSPNSPDDMILGLCLKNLNIPLTHSSLMHQARPSDYAKDFLRELKHVSFHKHWMVDPFDVYETWLKDAPFHSEL